MEQDLSSQSAAQIRQLQFLWLGFAFGVPFSAGVLLIALPAQWSGAELPYLAVGLLSALMTLPMVSRFRRALDDFAGGRDDNAMALQRAMVFGAMTSEIPLFIGILQFLLHASAPALLLLCLLSFVLLMFFRPRLR